MVTCEIEDVPALMHFHDKHLDEQRHIFERWFSQFNDCLLEALEDLSLRQDAWNEKFVETLSRKQSYKEKPVDILQELSSEVDNVDNFVTNGVDGGADIMRVKTNGSLKSTKSTRSGLPCFVQRSRDLSLDSDELQRRQFHKDILDQVQNRRHIGGQTKARLEAASHMSMWVKPPRSFIDFVHSKLFDKASGVLTIIFAIIVGMEADMEIEAAWKNEEAPEWIRLGAFVCNACFAVECIFRISAGGLVYFCGRDWLWNWFDFVLVGFSVLDMIGRGSALGFFRIARATKVVKAFRVIRVLKLVSELRLLLVSLVKSLAALIWSLIFLITITYLASICFTQGAAVYLRDSAKDPLVVEELRAYYLNIAVTMYTLVACVTGGDDWRPAGDAIQAVGWVYGSAFMVFVLVTVLGLMNVITGIFVEHASNIVDIDREVAIMHHLKNVESDVVDALSLFSELDTAREGKVSIAKLKLFCKLPRVIAYFATFDMHVTEAEDFVQLFDIDEDGMVSEEEFVLVCMSSRGSSTKADVMLNDMNVAKHLHHLDLSMQKIYGTLRDSRRSIKAHSGRPDLPNAMLGDRPVNGNISKSSAYQGREWSL